MSLAAVLLASGHGKRFGGDKLFYMYEGASLIERAFMSIPRAVFDGVFVVARSEDVLELAEARGFTPVPNPDVADNVAETVRLGIGRLPEGTGGCMFLVCDQPGLLPETVAGLAAAFADEPGRIWALSYGGRRGNPVIFPASLFGELAALPFDTGGRFVIERHPELLSLYEAASPGELEDMDAPR